MHKYKKIETERILNPITDERYFWSPFTNPARNSFFRNKIYTPGVMVKETDLSKLESDVNEKEN